MEFRYQLRYLLIRTLLCSHAQADLLCREGKVEVNGIPETNPRRILKDHEEIRVDGILIRKGIQFRYVAFYKPHGFECTTNRAIPGNIYELLPSGFQDLFPLGRLDKNSEGLLLLTNNGTASRELMDRDAAVEKEYRVITHRPVSEALEKSFREPFLLGQRWTLPARFEREGDFSFRVILTEGINRHIRRICAKNENQVKQLIRIRVGNIRLENLQSGDWRELPDFFRENDPA